uniref:Transposon protein, putative, CACTA, En/Spm sub-class n=1 Tax=Oryza sativa subsp. japonica TaxID=39947 RepID=H2KW42_ORYSJ|nr:transposon protein, putative, CACTA, En/Spm sub-class [Oryza sativa Japonica Group]
MYKERYRASYIEGVDIFMKTAKKNVASKKTKDIRCPCVHCKNRKIWKDPSVIEQHLVTHGFVARYTNWSHHGEIPSKQVPNQATHSTVDDADYCNVSVDDEYEDLDRCPTCKSSRYKTSRSQSEGQDVALDQKPEGCFWEDIRHSIDVMRLEKNVFDSTIGTILDIPIKTKDGLKPLFLAIAIRAVEPVHIKLVITKLCYFFNSISQKVIDPEELGPLRAFAIQTVCELEMCFPPSFFDMMQHLIVHIVPQIIALGSLYLHQMWPFERYMSILKDYVRNRAHPEGSMIEGYTTEEVVECCIDYLKDGKAIGLPQLAIVEPYIEQHLHELQATNVGRSNAWIMKKHKHHFTEWFKYLDLPDGHTMEERTIKMLADGPSSVYTSWQAYDLNGYTFYTKAKDKRSACQNSGVRVETIDTTGQKSTYYGFIEEICELDYGPNMQIPLFRCQWVKHPADVFVDNFGLTIVDFDNVGHKDDPWVLAAPGPSSPPPGPPLCLFLLSTATPGIAAAAYATSPGSRSHRHTPPVISMDKPTQEQPTGDKGKETQLVMEEDICMQVVAEESSSSSSSEPGSGSYHSPSDPHPSPAKKRKGGSDNEVDSDYVPPEPVKNAPRRSKRKAQVATEPEAEATAVVRKTASSKPKKRRGERGKNMLLKEPIWGISRWESLSRHAVVFLVESDQPKEAYLEEFEFKEDAAWQFIY